MFKEIDLFQYITLNWFGSFWTMVPDEKDHSRQELSTKEIGMIPNKMRMMGLRVVLEVHDTYNSADKTQHILSKSSMINNQPASFSSCPQRPPWTCCRSNSNTAFLDECYLCKRNLLHHQDIYMYRDRAFCSERCRCKLLMIEDSRRR